MPELLEAKPPSAPTFLVSLLVLLVLQFSYDVLECIRISLLMNYDFLGLEFVAKVLNSSNFWPQISDQLENCKNELLTN